MVFLLIPQILGSGKFCLWKINFQMFTSSKNIRQLKKKTLDSVLPYCVYIPARTFRRAEHWLDLFHRTWGTSGTPVNKPQIKSPWLDRLSNNSLFKLCSFNMFMFIVRSHKGSQEISHCHLTCWNCNIFKRKTAW